MRDAARLEHHKHGLKFSRIWAIHDRSFQISIPRFVLGEALVLPGQGHFPGQETAGECVPASRINGRRSIVPVSRLCDLGECLTGREGISPSGEITK